MGKDSLKFSLTNVDKEYHGNGIFLKVTRVLASNLENLTMFHKSVKVLEVLEHILRNNGVAVGNFGPQYISSIIINPVNMSATVGFYRDLILCPRWLLSCTRTG